MRFLLILKNTGQHADSDIMLSITPSSNCLFLSEYEGKADKPEMPERPRMSHDLGTALGLSRSVVFGGGGMKVRSIVRTTERLIEVEIFKLRASEELPVLNDPIICEIEGLEACLEIKINSHRTTGPIQKSLHLKLPT